MPRQLTNLKIEEVSSVDRGAGRGVRVVMTKRDASTEIREYTPEQLDKALNLAIASVLADESVKDKPAEIRELFKQFAEFKEQHMPLSKEDIDALTKALSEKFELVEKMTPSHQAYADNLDGDESKRFAAMGHGDRDKYVKDNPINAPDRGLDEGDSRHKPKGRTKPTGGGDSAAGDTGKAKKVEKNEGAMDEEITKAIRDENEVLKKRVIALEEKDQKVEFAKRAKEIGLAEVDGELLRKASRGDPEAFGQLEQKIKALTTQVEKSGLLSEIGTQESGSNSASEELVVKAKEVQKRDGIDYHSAYVKAMQEYPEIAKRESEERHARIQKFAR